MLMQISLLIKAPSKLILVLTALLSFATAQTTCSGALEPSYSANVASGYHIGLVATGLARPRGIRFDNAGRLLVVEAPRNGEPTISAITLNDSGGTCVRETNKKEVVRGQGVSGPLSVNMHTLMLGSAEPWNRSI
jgi:hypothetical protein